MDSSTVSLPQHPSVCTIETAGESKHAPLAQGGRFRAARILTTNGSQSTISATQLYDSVHCPHRVHMDAFAAQENETTLRFCGTPLGTRARKRAADRRSRPLACRPLSSTCAAELLSRGGSAPEATQAWQIFGSKASVRIMDWVKEDPIPWINQSVLSVVWWENESQLIDLDSFDEKSASRRSDGRRNWD